MIRIEVNKTAKRDVINWPWMTDIKEPTANANTPIQLTTFNIFMSSYNNNLVTFSLFMLKNQINFLNDIYFKL